MSLALFQHYHLAFAWSNQLKKTFSNQDLGRLKKLKKSLTQGNSVSVGNRRFDPSRLKQVFNNYFEQDSEKTRRLKEKHEELSLEVDGILKKY